MPRADRRRSVRYAVRKCTVLFRRRRMFLLFEKEGHQAPVLDLSSHGIGFLTKRSVTPGDVIRVTFDLPYEVYAVPPGFAIKARVAWLTPAPGEPGLRRVGCTFHRLKREEHDLITRIIRFGILRER